ncbi:hypothetical protein ACIHEI_22195 [Kitasatospora sp. NPDC051984]|uniref:hypothetical protein n=1 Tax=Kitasatospora sp. NPDC051984 TaxID=3364059 RepID=UPI0037C7A952
MKTVHARTLGLRIAALAAAGLVLTACNEDDAATGATGQTSPSAVASAPASAKASGKAKEPVKPSAHASGSTTGGDAAAQAKTNKIALTEKEWDNAFVSDGDDYTGLFNSAMDKSCKFNPDTTSDKGLQADTYRYVRQDHEKDSTYASTGAMSFTTADAAVKEIAKRRDNTRRCPNYTNDDAHAANQGVHEIESPKVPGADEVYAEEGRAVYDTDGGGKSAARPFTSVIARKGSITVEVFVDLDPDRQASEGRGQALDALKKLTAKW